MESRLALTFCDTAQEMLVVELGCALPEGDHTRLYTDGLQLCAIELVCAPCQLLVVHVLAHRHLPGMDLENACACGLVGERELDFAVETPRAEERGVEDVDTVRGGDDLSSHA